ncbi:MAG TPA: heme-copper oxidase subunit III [Candidatus Dormibacteraeota bacterium]|nr:heme-copper oxidase subunit III [Candidatus Dormibacteraeota bacterium]
MTAGTAAMRPSEQGPPLLHDARGGISNPVLGMLLFLTSEVMFFAGLFAAYFNVRAAAPQWPPAGFGDKLHVFPLIAPATVLLILSSFTCQFGVWAIRRGDRTAFLRFIGVTVALRIVFLLMQATDYTLLFGDGLTLDSGVFGSTYYTLTGFHGAHVLGGVIMLSVILYRGMTGQFSARHHDAVEATSLYWHFVDIVWIVLFSTLYILPASH